MSRWDWSFNHEFRVCFIFQALIGTKVSLSQSERTFLVAGPASAAPGKAAGTKRKRRIEQGKGPVEKKACGEGPEPALPPEELKRICLSSTRLEQWCHMPFFATTVTGCFVRVAMEDGSKDPLHCLAQIVSVMETEQVYQLVSKRTNLGFQLRHAGKDQIVTLRSASNKEFTNCEFMQWKLAMLAAGMQVPTPEEIATKEKSINEALAHTFTQKETDFIVAQKNRFRSEPLNVAKRKIQLLFEQNTARSYGDANRVKEIQGQLKMFNKGTEVIYQTITTEDDLKNLFRPVVRSSRAPAPKAETDPSQVIDPFARRKTRPIMVTSFKNHSVREAIYTELDRRYGCGSTEE